MPIEVQHVTKIYECTAEPCATVRALDDVSLSIPAGEWLAVMGPSGSGKSTLANLLGCLDRPTSGKILISGEDLSTLSAAEMNRFRAEKIGFIFQQFHLIPHLTAVENVMLAQYFHSMTDEKEAREALERVGLGHRADHLPAQLSGGEQQRACIARALINDPHIVLADEPTGNLDAQNEEIVLRILRDLHQAGRTIVMVTHDPTVARLADRRVDLHHGRIAAQQVFSMADEEQVDEALEEIWIVMENGEPAELGRIEVDGAVPTRMLIERMAETGLVHLQQHPPQPHEHKEVLNRCHDAIRPHGQIPADGDYIVELTTRGRQRAADIIRRHRLAERLFADTFAMQDETELESNACTFEHILSPEVTERICTFLNHPAACPHGSPIPKGSCCAGKR